MAEPRPPLENEIRRLIGIAGPISIADYMRLCLTHPQYGYYVTRDPLGAKGDFVTSPEISQMFGELIGLWMATIWQKMGSPENVRLIELGPGRGSMLLDALRVAKVVQAFLDAIVLHLVEISPALQRMQQERLDSLGIPTMWHAKMEDVPDGPTIIVANEFIDALPIHQAVKQADGWHERVVEITASGDLAFAAAATPLPFFEATMPRKLRACPEGSMYEWRDDRMALDLGRRVRDGGAALIIDYGHADCALGETLQAVAAHAYANPLRSPGEADLTAHVDFEALGQSAESIGARIHGPATQRDFLRRLGIDKRANALKISLPPEKAADIDIALARLTGEGPRQMGALFKVMAMTDPKLRSLPGFETRS